LARVLRSIRYRTEGSEAVARLILDPAQLQSLAASLDSLRRARPRDRGPDFPQRSLKRCPEITWTGCSDWGLLT